MDDVSQYDAVELYGNWYTITAHRTTALNNTTAHIAASNTEDGSVRFVWREDGEYVVCFLLVDKVYQHTSHPKTAFSVHERNARNKTDYALPQNWREMDADARAEWYAIERAARQAAVQDTAWGRGYDVLRERMQRTSADQYRHDDDETFK